MTKRLQQLYTLRFFALTLFILTGITGIAAQDSIVAYSDTTSALSDTMTDDSIYHSSSASAWPDEDITDDLADHNIFEFMSHLLGITGVIAILTGVLILLFPLIAIGVIIYLLYRLNREKQRHTEQIPPSTPENMSAQAILYKETAIRRACWGIGLILVEWIADIADLLYIIGVVLLCMAAFSWMRAQIRK